MRQCARSKNRRKDGLSVIEMVVALGVITAVSSVVLVSFSGYNQHIAANRASRELILFIRKVQNIALSVIQIGGVTPPYSGIKLTVGTGIQKHPIFADNNGNFFYDAAPPADFLIEELVFERGIYVNALTQSDGTGIPGNVVNILFEPPEARISLTNNNGGSVGDYVKIELRSPSGIIKHVVVRTSGQITNK